jgi:hypothetical protein
MNHFKAIVFLLLFSLTACIPDEEDIFEKIIQNALDLNPSEAQISFTDGEVTETFILKAGFAEGGVDPFFIPSRIYFHSSDIAEESVESTKSNKTFYTRGGNLWLRNLKLENGSYVEIPTTLAELKEGTTYDIANDEEIEGII